MTLQPDITVISPRGIAVAGLRIGSPASRRCRALAGCIPADIMSNPFDRMARIAACSGKDIIVTALDCEITLATVDDIPGIVELQGSNLLSNGGFLSIEFPNDWFERVLPEMPIIVARKNNRIVGYLVSSPVSVAAHAPIIQAKLRAYPGSANPYNHGPVCIAKDERNQGLIARMFEALRERLKGREGIAFVRRDNAASLSAHAKLGMRQVAEFTHDGVAYVVVAYIA